MDSADIINLHSELRDNYTKLDGLHTNISLLGGVNNFYERDLILLSQFKKLILSYSIDKVAEGNERKVYQSSTGLLSTVPLIMDTNTLLNTEMIELLSGVNTLLNTEMNYNFKLA